MPMNPNFLCCIGAELKNSTQQTTRMSQVYFYRAFEEETVADMLQPGFFDAAMGIVRKDDLLLLYDPKDQSARWTYCRVSNVDRSGVEISLMGINAKDVLVEISGEDPITLQSLIDNTIMPAIENIGDTIMQAIENIGDMDLPVITEGGTAPTNLSEAIRQIVTQNLTLSEDSVEPQSGQFSLWGAIKKALGNAKNFFSSISDLDTRLNALEGQGGPVGSYDFGKSFPNILDATDTQLVAGVMVDNIWAGHTPIVWTTPIANSTFTDGDGVDRTVGEIFNGTWIINSYDGTRIVLTNTPNTTPPIFSYQNVGVYSVGFANTTMAGVVRVGTGSDMTVNQNTGDISIDDTKGYSIFHRLISLFTSAEKTQIRSDLNAASRDMDYLSATGQNIANWSSNVSNCITEIPQDIKLELYDGILTLKAGSKLYVPNGAGVFDEVVIENDLTHTVTGNDIRFVYYDKTNNYLRSALVSNASSGTSSSSTGLFYNTGTNIIDYLDSGVGRGYNASFPLAIISVNTTSITSIDQVFNGFGYIGSTVFALPGVKGLVPNGRNADGSLKSVAFTTDHVLTVTLHPQTYSAYFGLTDEGLDGAGIAEFLYDEKLNLIRLIGGGAIWSACICAFGKVVSGKITEFTPKTVFHALDYNDTEYIAHQAMPSNRYVDITAPAHGNSMTAPADGWFVVRGYASSGAYVWLRNENNGLAQTAPTGSSGSISYCSLRVKKGDVIQVGYYGGTLTMCRFIYANGAQ